MALATSINFTFVDQKNKSKSTKVRIPSTVSIANGTAFAQDIAQLMANCSNARLDFVELTFHLDIANVSLNSIASAFSSVGEKALFAFRSAVAGLFGKFQIPTFDEAVVMVAGTDQIDITDTDIIAFLTGIEDGIEITGAVVVQETNKYGDDLTSNTIAREVFVEHV